MGPRGSLGEAIKPQTSVLLAILLTGLDVKNLQCYSSPSWPRYQANCHYISSFICNISYEYDTMIVRKEVGLIQLKVLAHELLMSKVYILVLQERAKLACINVFDG
jgi:hypothetical protein